MTGVRALTRTVVIDGEVYRAGDVPPPGIAERIRNPQCWAPVTAEPGPNWTPESDSGRVPQAEPPVDGLRNLEPQPANTASSAVVQASPGTIIGAPAQQPPAIEPAGDAGEPEPVPAETPAAGTPLPEPPRSGRGATTAAWRAYAQQYGVTVPAEADRGDIIAQLKDSGHIQ